MRCEKHDPKNTAAIESYVNAGLPCPKCVIERLDRIGEALERLAIAAEGILERADRDHRSTLGGILR